MGTNSATMRNALKWFTEEKERFIYPIRITKATKTMIKFDFDGYAPAISGCITTELAPFCVLQVVVNCDESGADDVTIPRNVNPSGTIYWKEFVSVKPIQKPSMGWCCPQCNTDNKGQYIQSGEYYPTLDDLLIQHHFEPFLNWCNNNLPSLENEKLKELSNSKRVFKNTSKECESEWVFNL